MKNTIHLPFVGKEDLDVHSFGINALLETPHTTLKGLCDLNVHHQEMQVKMFLRKHASKKKSELLVSGDTEWKQSELYREALAEERGRLGRAGREGDKKRKSNLSTPSLIFIQTPVSSSASPPPFPFFPSVIFLLWPHLFHIPFHSFPLISRLT